MLHRIRHDSTARASGCHLTEDVMRDGLNTGLLLEDDAFHQQPRLKRRKRVAKSLAELPNIGPTIEKRLNEVGIRTRSDLSKLGAVNAYLRICAKYPRQTISVCYYLYSLQGALMGLHWDDLPERLKQDLLVKATGRKSRERGSR